MISPEHVFASGGESVKCVSAIAQRNNEVPKTQPTLTRVSLSRRASLLPVFRCSSRLTGGGASGREASTHHGWSCCQQLQRDLPEKPRANITAWRAADWRGLVSLNRTLLNTLAYRTGQWREESMMGNAAPAHSQTLRAPSHLNGKPFINESIKRVQCRYQEINAGLYGAASHFWVSHKLKSS